MNFFFGFNDTKLVRKLVQAVRVFQPSSPGLSEKSGEIKLEIRVSGGRNAAAK